jgi:hypothetical protein
MARNPRFRGAVGAVIAAPSIWAALKGIEKVCRPLNKIKIRKNICTYDDTKMKVKSIDVEKLKKFNKNKKSN